jgi:hypothetical protein
LTLGRTDLMNRATLLSQARGAVVDRRLARLVDFLGIDCDTLVLDDPAAPSDLAPALLDRDHCCVMTSAATLGVLLSRGGHRNVLHRLLERTRYLFVYGFRPVPSDVATLRQLSAGLLDSVTDLPPGDARYAISADWPSLTGAFTGLSFGPAQPTVDSVFATAQASPALRPIVSIAESPSFASFSRGGCSVFVLAGNDIADLDASVNSQLRAVDWFSRVIPPMMFIKHAFEGRVWHNPRPTASFIIDDPLLKERYGFLNYRHLLRAMGDQPFAATIAFIPFNFRRSAASAVELFRAHPHRFSLCIHGCNHTGGEFATSDLSTLNTISRLAVERMRLHEKATALTHGKIMVFPQGRFSVASLKALRGNGYAAAVNSSPMPDSASPDAPLRLREWLDLAVTRYHGFPLFVRRYPGDLANFAFDLFLGKPLLIVEHHTAFRGGYQGVADFVAAVNSLNPTLQWGSLQETLGHASLQRRSSSASVDVRVWSNRSVLCNDEPRGRTYALTKQEAADAKIQEVTVDDRRVDYTVHNGMLKLSVDVEPLASRVVEIRYANDLPIGDAKMGFRTALAIHARRRLSELRDEWLHQQYRFRTLSGFGR